MHLGFLTPEYPHPFFTYSGGLGTSIKNLVTALTENGTEITVFVYGQKENKIFSEDGIKFHSIKHQEYLLFGWYLHRKYLQEYINKYIKQNKIDTIEAPDWTGITAFLKFVCPLVLRFHGTDAYFCKLENRPQKKKNFWFEKLALLNADHLISVSEFTARKTKGIFNLKKGVTVIPNSVDVEYFNPSPALFNNNTTLYFGSIIRKKGVLELAEIFNLIVQERSKTKLIFAGKDVRDIKTGKSTKELICEKFSPRASKNVEWLGTLPYEEILEQIANAHVVVLPSFAEALPMTWLEAMAMEKPLVTSDIGWAKEVMIDGETGFTVYPKNHEEFAEKILQLLNDPSIAIKMGKAARKRVIEKFSTDVVVEQNIKFYRSIIDH